MQKIIPPKNCPSCNSELEWRNDLLYCTNKLCGKQTQKSIEHWAKTLKIKGLGPQTIQKLGLSSILDIYTLTEDKVRKALGSEKLATKLIAEIEKSKEHTLENVLPAFGISLIGNTATQKLCSYISHIDEITKEKAKEAGLGPKAVENLLDWFENEYKDIIKPNLPMNLKVEKRKKVPTKGIVCISGKLNSFKTKKDAEIFLTSVGYIVKPSVTKDVTILINESGVESAKTKKAREAGLLIVENLNTLLGD